MCQSQKLVAGFDPGGVGSFGWCVAKLSPWCVIKTGIANHAHDALCKVKKRCEHEGKLIAAGIDAPLYWTYKGDSREADNHVRNQIHGKVKAPAGTVQAVNSLRGACLIQGFHLARKIQSDYPDCFITETHPKALLAINGEAKKASEPYNDNKKNHERDAVVSAWVAAHHTPKHWENLYLREKQRDVYCFLDKTRYWWPKSNDHQPKP